jgi:predicted enzyme related to lactoylglutathione lyase
MTNTFTPANAAVWFEIPVTDMDRSRAFYGAVLQTTLELEEGGPNPMAAFPGSGESSVRGHLYPGHPAASGNGPTVHLASPEPLEDAIARVGQNGGKVVSPIIEIPAGRFAYCLDPDGNSFGLFAS